MIALERYWLAEDRKTVVRDLDKRAAYLLCVPGEDVPAEYVAKVAAIQSKPEKPKP